MKYRLLFSFFILSLSYCSLFAQFELSGVSYKILFPKDIGDGPLSDIVEEQEFTLGVQASAIKNINDWLVVDVPLRLGTVEVREFATESVEDRLFLGIDANLVARIDPIKFPFGPYAFIGLGGDYQDLNGNNNGEFNAYIPTGIGVNIKVSPAVWLNGEIQRRTSLTGVDNSHYQTSLGLIFNLDIPDEADEDLSNTIEMPPKDADGDGVPDDEDACPGVAGKAMFRGCPDSDNDGVIDSKDKCPDEAGPIATDGCPINAPTTQSSDGPDSDGDGVSDQNDNCPNTPGDPNTFGCPNVDTDGDGVVDAMDNCPNKNGLAIFGGCPDTDGDGVSDDKDACPTAVGLPKFAGCPDTDGDGITDAADNCPTLAGLSEYNGCPKPAPVTSAPSPPSTSTNPAPPISAIATETLTAAAQKVEFETARATLRSSSYAVLDQIVNIMNQYPSYSIEIAGHTDSIGDSAGNQKLSENRAKSCRDYLVRKGISPSRINHVGYGEKQPIADNRYRAGRAQNRRVEFRLIQ